MLFKALKVGESLHNPETWKVRQNAINAIMAAMGILFAMSPDLKAHLALSEDDVIVIAGGIAAIGGAINTYLTTATTKKIGLSNDTPPPDKGV